MAKKSQLTLLTEAIEKLINNPVAPVAPVLPIAPVAPVLPIVQPNSGDHDLLTSFRSESLVEFRTIKEAIKELTDGTSKRIADLEMDKLNCKESYQSLYKASVDKAIEDLQADVKSQGTAVTRLWAYGTALIFVVGIVEFFISNFVK